MADISLYVTSAVAAHAATAAGGQQQIAYKVVSPELAPQLQGATRTQRKRIRLGGLLILTVGDTSAIWRAHNVDNAADFDALFQLLKGHPNEALRLSCELLVE